MLLLVDIEVTLVVEAQDTMAVLVVEVSPMVDQVEEDLDILVVMEVIVLLAVTVGQGATTINLVK